MNTYIAIRPYIAQQIVEHLKKLPYNEVSGIINEIGDSMNYPVLLNWDQPVDDGEKKEKEQRKPIGFRFVEEEVEGEGSLEKEIFIDENLKQEVLQNMVLIDDSFSISKFLVTQKLYETVMGHNPSKFKDEPCGKESQEKRPVETVSYLEAIQFCNKLSELCGFSSCYNGDVYNENVKGFRLPTESEWYYVATGKKSNSFIYAGSNVPDGFAWYKHNSKSKTHEVGKKQPVMINETNGIFDMSGNVLEFVWDWFGNYKSVEAGTRATGPVAGSQRVSRGGSWSLYTPFNCAGDRYSFDPNEVYDYFGFRLAQSKK